MMVCEQVRQRLFKAVMPNDSSVVRGQSDAIDPLPVIEQAVLPCFGADAGYTGASFISASAARPLDIDRPQGGVGFDLHFQGQRRTGDLRYRAGL
ncbi:MAG: hypothetical protein QOF72_858 [Blastocatellia bacterium]|nr:hypothetical protein [Blastocatellia bacterium]